MVRSLGFGSTDRTNRPIQTRFRYGCGLRFHQPLTLLDPVTRRIILQQARYSAIAAPCGRAIGLVKLVCIRFQVLFTPRQGFFSPFPRGTRSLSVAREYLALEGGPPGFPRDFTCPVVLRNSSGVCLDFAYGAVTLYGRPFQDRSAIRRFLTPRFCTGRALQHRNEHAARGLGYSPFARHY